MSPTTTLDVLLTGAKAARLIPLASAVAGASQDLSEELHKWTDSHDKPLTSNPPDPQELSVRVAELLARSDELRDHAERHGLLPPTNKP